MIEKRNTVHLDKAAGTPCNAIVGNIFPALFGLNESAGIRPIHI